MKKLILLPVLLLLFSVNALAQSYRALPAYLGNTTNYDVTCMIYVYSPVLGFTLEPTTVVIPANTWLETPVIMVALAANCIATTITTTHTGQIYSRVNNLSEEITLGLIFAWNGNEYVMRDKW